MAAHRHPPPPPDNLQLSSPFLFLPFLSQTEVRPSPTLPPCCWAQEGSWQAKWNFQSETQGSTMPLQLGILAPFQLWSGLEFRGQRYDNPQTSDTPSLTCMPQSSYLHIQHPDPWEQQTATSELDPAL